MLHSAIILQADSTAAAALTRLESLSDETYVLLHLVKDGSEYWYTMRARDIRRGCDGCVDGDAISPGVGKPRSG